MGYLGTPIDTNNTFQSLAGKRFNGDASTTDFTLDVAPTSTLDIEVFVENVRQDPNSAYTLSGTTLAFAAAPGAGTNNIYVIHQAKAVGTISAGAGTVNADSMDNTVISGHDALAATPADTDEFLISDAGTIKRVDYSLIKTALTPAFCVRESGQQTLSHNTHTNLTFATEEVDSDGAFASNVFTVPSGQAGKYYIFAQLNLYDAEGNLSSGILNIWKGTNGTKLSSLYSVHANTNNTQNHLNISCAVIADLAEADVIGASATMTTDDSGTATSYGGDQGTRILGFKLAGV